MNILSNQGTRVLQKLFDNFRKEYIEKHPGCNGNDVERAFLYHVAPKQQPADIWNMIEDIQ